MYGTLMSGTRKTTTSGTTLTSSGQMRRVTMVHRQQCPILALTLTLTPSLALPITAVAIACRCSQGRGRPEGVIATAKTTLPPPPSTNITARPPSPLKTTTAISMQPLQRPSTLPRTPPSLLLSPLHSLQPLPLSLPSQPLSPLSSLPPSPLPPPPSLPPPLPPPPRPLPCLRCHYRCSLRQRHCISDAPVDGWLLCRLLLLARCVVRRPNLSTPPVVRLSTSTMTAIAAIDNCHRHCHSRR